MLDEILDNKRRELEFLCDLHEQELSPCESDIRAALRPPGLSIIAEVKRRSPSAGPLAESVDPVAQAKSYVEGGAAAISVLTDARYFGGSFEDVAAVAREVPVPLLCKEFILDERQIRHARRAGAAACLLIVAALSEEDLHRLLREVRRFNMHALVEVHDEAELDRALACGADIIGVNNRSLRTMQIDLNTVNKLSPRVPQHCVFVAESGYTDPSQLLRLPERVDAALIGSALMRSGQPASTLRDWLQAIKR